MAGVVLAALDTRIPNVLDTSRCTWVRIEVQRRPCFDWCGDVLGEARAGDGQGTEPLPGRLLEAANLAWRSASLAHFLRLELLSGALYNWLHVVVSKEFLHGFHLVIE